MEREAIVDLLDIEGIGELRVYQLLMEFKEPAAVFQKSEEDLCRVPGITREIAKRIKNYKRSPATLEKIKKMERKNIKVVFFFEDQYPSLLKNISSFPPVLFYRGELRKDDFAIAIVGTRKATAYGLYVAERLARELACENITIISGLARGIDTAAHKGALKENGKTIAVLGCGLDVYYPPENRRLQDEIAEKGLLISEYNIGTSPNAFNFPKRNRIIAGLSKGVIVVEAGEQSGALNTIAWAAEQGKEIFAVPGQIYARSSKGTNRLIKDGAKLVTSADDVLEEFSLTKKEKREVSYVKISDLEKRVLSVVSSEPLYVDEIVEKIKLPINQVLETLLSLEIKGFIRELPGKKYISLNV